MALDVNGNGSKPPSSDPFANLRMDQSFIESASVKKLLTTVPVRKPSKQEYIRVHPDEAYRGNFAVIELKEDREYYVVTPNAAADLKNEIKFVTLFTAINRQGVAFLWPVPISGTDKRTQEWYRSAREGAELAMGGWYRVQANLDLGAYEMTPAAGAIPDPEWPEHTHEQLLRIAFRDRFVDQLDHPVVRRLRGV